MSADVVGGTSDSWRVQRNGRLSILIAIITQGVVNQKSNITSINYSPAKFAARASTLPRGRWLKNSQQNGGEKLISE